MPIARLARSAVRTGRRHRLATVALLLVAVNLRPAVTSVGPVLEEIRASLGMNATVAGLLTSVPAGCFALVGFLAPRLSARYGPDVVIAAGGVATVAGLAVRPLAGGAAAFIALTAAALAGIALVNVLLPVVVKRYFPQRVGAMTGLYTMALNLGATAAAALTVPVTGVFGGSWRAGLGIWAAVAALAVPPWIALARDNGGGSRAAADAGAPGPAAGLRLARHPTAWALGIYFGLQATSAYVLAGWLAQIFRDAGLPAPTAGLLFAITSLLAMPLSLVLSAAAGRRPNQSGIAAALGLSGLAGYAGLWAAPAAAPWLWAVLLGAATASFPLALTMIGLRGRDSATVVRLSAFAQSTGYLLSIPGPILVGALYQHTGGWHAPLTFVAVLMLAQTAAGVVAGRNRQLG
jgi:CP family cyanate transporter-like MFS transporter